MARDVRRMPNGGSLGWGFGVEITIQAGRRGAWALLQEGAAGSFLPVTPFVTPAPIILASKRLGPQGHKFLLSLVSLQLRLFSRCPTVIFITYESHNCFYHFFLIAALHTGRVLLSFSLKLEESRPLEGFREFF